MQGAEKTYQGFMETYDSARSHLQAPLRLIVGESMCMLTHDTNRLVLQAPWQWHSRASCGKG